jgi:hypothetical protein
VVDSDTNKRWTPGERIVFRTPVPYRVATNNTLAEFSSSVPSGIVKLPGAGDTNYVFTTRPIRQGETYTFTASRSLVLDAPRPGSGRNSFSLLQNYPNPFNPRTTIRYSIPTTGRVILTVYSILGQRVAALVDEIQSGGNYRVSFDGRQVASGLYFYRLEHGGRMVTQKMLMVK